MQQTRLRILIIGAHPDDADLSAGGSAILWSRVGHRVRIVSLTNGDAGHFEMARPALAARRLREAKASGERLGAEYCVLDNHDGELDTSIDTRLQVIREIRQFEPDLILTPRPWDYHPDHRATAQLVADATYMVTVPLVLPEIPALREMPVVAYVWDRFQKPYPFHADVAVDIDPVLDTKIDALHCHTSQVYEWLPYNRRLLESVPVEEGDRRAMLCREIGRRSGIVAISCRPLLAQRYGEERAMKIKSAEAFEVSEYGTQPTAEDLERLFPF